MFIIQEIASALIAGVVVVVVDTVGGRQWLEKKIGCGLDSTEKDLLKKISSRDKAQGIADTEIKYFCTEFSDLTLDDIVKRIDKLKSKGLVKSAIAITGNVTTTQEGDAILRNRKIVSEYIPLNIGVVVISIAYLVSQNLILSVFLGLFSANIKPLFNFLRECLSSRGMNKGN